LNASVASQTTDGVRVLPRQGRSRAVVDAILEAAAQLLEQEGEAGLNTNVVSERAGVSIGSLYRYFADKEAILLALARRETASVQMAMRLALTENAGIAADRAAIRAFLGAFAGRTIVRRLALKRIIENDGSAHDDGAGIAALLRDSHGQPLPDLRAFVLLRALLGAIRAAVFERPALLASPEFEDELVCLARRYANAAIGTGLKSPEDQA
jgi:AcrR family transcriptional regulator